jgi:hypothetical protein
MNIFLKVYNNRWVLSGHALIVFTICCFLVDEKLKLKVFAYSFKNSSSNPLQDPKAAIWTLKSTNHREGNSEEDFNKNFQN